MRAVAGVVQGRVFGIVIVAMMVMADVRAMRAGFRLERRFGLADGAAQPLHHLGQHVIGLETQLAAVFGRHDLHRHMAVAEVVGGAGEEQRAGGDGFDQFFRCGEDLDDGRAVFGDQLVAAVQVVAAFEKDAGFGARSQRHLEAAALAFVVGQRDRVGGGLLGALVEDQHGQNRK